MANSKNASAVVLVEKDRIRDLVLSMLSDECGVDQESYNHLWELLDSIGMKNLLEDVEATDGRFYFPVDGEMNERVNRSLTGPGDELGNAVALSDDGVDLDIVPLTSTSGSCGAEDCPCHEEDCGG